MAAKKKLRCRMFDADGRVEKLVRNVVEFMAQRELSLEEVKFVPLVQGRGGVDWLLLFYEEKPGIDPLGSTPTAAVMPQEGMRKMNREEHIARAAFIEGVELATRRAFSLVGYTGVELEREVDAILNKYIDDDWQASSINRSLEEGDELPMWGWFFGSAQVIHDDDDDDDDDDSR